MKFILYLIFALCLFPFASCSVGSAADKADSDSIADTLTVFAKRLTLVQHSDYIEALIHNPGKVNEPTVRYAFIQRADSASVAVPDGCRPVYVPVQRAVVYSMVHTGGIDELGSASRVVGVADADYFPESDTFYARLKDGRVADIGSSMSPSIEKIIDLNADAVILTPMGGAEQQTERAGLTTIYMVDYLEATPLGRAEWIKLLGCAFNNLNNANAIYANVCKKYNEICRRTEILGSDRPKVLTERPYSGTWYVPAGGSYMAALIADAGGICPWEDVEGAGSIPLDISAVIDKASDARVWLIKTDTDLTARQMAAVIPHVHAFSAYPFGVYVCNTKKTTYYRDIAFHPELILSDIAALCNPAIIHETGMRYFQPIK